MKTRVLNALLDKQLLPVTNRDVTEWPSRAALINRIQNTPEYRAVCDVGLPSDRKLEDVINSVLETFEGRLVNAWIFHHLHDCLSMHNLDDDDERGRPGLVNTFLMESCGNLLGLHPLFQTPNDVFKQYYLTLQNTIVSTLYNDKKPYSLEELELLVPAVESEFYDRDKIITEYIKEINQLKSPKTRAKIEAEINSFVTLYLAIKQKIEMQGGVTHFETSDTSLTLEVDKTRERLLIFRGLVKGKIVIGVILTKNENTLSSPECCDPWKSLEKPFMEAVYKFVNIFSCLSKNY